MNESLGKERGIPSHEVAFLDYVHERARKINKEVEKAKKLSPEKTYQEIADSLIDKEAHI